MIFWKKYLPTKQGNKTVFAEKMMVLIGDYEEKKIQVLADKLPHSPVFDDTFKVRLPKVIQEQLTFKTTNNYCLIKDEYDTVYRKRKRN